MLLNRLKSVFDEIIQPSEFILYNPVANGVPNAWLRRGTKNQKLHIGSDRVLRESRLDGIGTELTMCFSCGSR